MARSTQESESGSLLQLAVEGDRVGTAGPAVLPSDQIVGKVAAPLPILFEGVPHEVAVLNVEKPCREDLSQNGRDVFPGAIVAAQGPAQLAQHDAAHVQALPLGLHVPEERP